MDALGLGSLEYPQDLCCPITFLPMVDPVVASDGHSYERDAIETVLQRGNGLSPLTREPLKRSLIANRTLLKRIHAYEGEMLACAETAVEAASAAATSHKRQRRGDGA